MTSALSPGPQDLLGALRELYPPGWVDLLTASELDDIDRIIVQAEQRRDQEKRKAVLAAESLILSWDYGGKNSRWPSGSLQVANRESSWFWRRAWLRVCRRDGRNPPWQWEVQCKGSDHVFGPPTSDPAKDFEEHALAVEMWFKDRGYQIRERPAASEGRPSSNASGKQP